MEFIDLKAQYRALKSEIDESIQRVLDHGQFIMGPEVAQVEAELAEFTGRKYCVSCGNGTDALELLCMAVGLEAGDALFCPDVTFIATVEPAVRLGAVPVFCDIDPLTYNLCPKSLERQVQAVIKEGKLRPRMVISVDFLGNPADYDGLRAVCDKYGLLLVEDAAQSFGATYRGKPCGGLGHDAASSFFPAKPLGCYGDGGAVFTDDIDTAEMIRSFRSHGKGRDKYDNVRIGLNSRLDTMQAAILSVKLDALQRYEMADRQVIAARYDKAFKARFVTPHVAEGATSAYAQYALLANDRAERDAVMAALKAQGIPTMIYYPTPQHMLPVFADVVNYGEPFATSIDYCARTFALPMHSYLGEEEQQQVIKAVLGAVKA